MYVSYCNPADIEERRTEVLSLMEFTSANSPTLIGSDKGSFLTLGTGPLVISAPHEEEHIRDGASKVGESGTGAIAMALATCTSALGVATYGPQTGDPNWDPNHPFTDFVIAAARGGAVIDLHLMRPRGFEVCLGLGPDHEVGRPIWSVMLDEMLAADVRVALNYPFGARGRPIVSRAQEAGVPGVQIEIAFDILEPGSDPHACVLSALLRATKTLSDMYRFPNR